MKTKIKKHVQSIIDAQPELSNEEWEKLAIKNLSSSINVLMSDEDLELARDYVGELISNH